MSKQSPHRDAVASGKQSPKLKAETKAQLVDAVAEEQRVIFRWPDASRQVAIAGTFTDWQPVPLTRSRAKAGGCARTFSLPRGEHQYKFVVDGEWINDPAAAESRPNGLGTTNSILLLE